MKKSNRKGYMMRSNFEEVRTWIGLTLSIVALLTISTFIPAAGSDSSDPISSDECLLCHEGVDRNLFGTPHRLTAGTDNLKTEVACVDCHTGGATHIDDPSADNIGIATRLTGHAAAELCNKCHESHASLDDYGFNLHSELELNCTSCHRVKCISESLLQDSEGYFCLTCHEDKVTGFMGVSNHPVFQEQLSCLSCHRFVKRQVDNAAYDPAGVCGQCHPEKAGPFLYEHDAATAYAVDGGGCLECHAPHGSENNYLLKQSGQDLCRQCHLPPPEHAQNSAHDDAWARYDCIVCHTDIHGSFDNNLFLDPNLQARWGANCYLTGCHEIGR